MDRSPPSRGSIRESGAPLMTRSQPTHLGNWRINLSKVAFVGALVGACAVGVAAQANADPGNCDPFYLSMTPQPVLSCTAPDPAPPAVEAPMPEPVSDVVGLPPGELLPGEVPPPGDPLLPPPSDP